jgi:hypothetical protein
VTGKLDASLNGLEAMSPAELRAEWQRVMKSPCPRFGPDLLRHAIGHHLQGQADRTPTMAANRALRAATSNAAASLRPGTHLLRSWNGRDISVLVTNRGFEFDGRNWTSLSAIAREVTGTAWSGPRFFGLKGMAHG